MLHIMVVGCNGSMGKVLCNQIESADNMLVSVGIGKENTNGSDFPIYPKFHQVIEPVDVIIDFSHPHYLQELLPFALEKKIPLVICTTGFSTHQINQIQQASQTIPLLLSSNMSLGINIMLMVAKQITKFLGSSFDIEILEKHHNQKIDAPSGTALLLADNVNEELNTPRNYCFDRSIHRKKRPKSEIGIHSIRGGTIVGEHELIFAGKDEILTLTHQANSKLVFATGAICAAEFLVKQPPNFYTIDSMIQEG